MLLTEHHHHSHESNEGKRFAIVESIYSRTHRVLRGPKILNKEGRRWNEITDEIRIKELREEIAEIEERLRRVGEFDNLRPLQQEVFINGFAHEQNKLDEIHSDPHDDHSHGEECHHDHKIINKLIKNPKVKRIAAGILCQFDCTIPAALNILGALFGGIHGADHHDSSAILSSQPQIVFEHQGKQLATIPVNRQVTQQELERFQPATQALIADHIEMPTLTGQIVNKRQARKAAQRRSDNEQRWYNWLQSLTQQSNPLQDWAIRELNNQKYIGKHRTLELAQN